MIRLAAQDRFSFQDDGFQGLPPVPIPILRATPDSLVSAFQIEYSNHLFNSIVQLKCAFKIQLQAHLLNCAICICVSSKLLETYLLGIVYNQYFQSYENRSRLNAVWFL